MVDLTATSFDQMRGSEEAESVQEDWVRCMADEGFDLEDWQSAALRLLEVGGEVTSQERRHAQAVIHHVVRRCDSLRVRGSR
jgi:hypothetical protein